MANLKRRPDKDLNHDNWDEEDPPEEKGEFRRAAEDDLRNRRILKPRRKLATGNSEAGASGSANPFSSFAFGIGRGGGASTSASAAATAPTPTPAFSFGLPANPLVAGGSGIGRDSSTLATGGSTGSLFKIAGITPSSEPPTRASADSSTTDNPAEAVGTTPGTNSGSASASGEADVAEVGSESDGIAEESSNSSSYLPWNISARQRDDSNAAVDSNNLHGSGGSGDLNNPSWLDDDLDDKEASAASSEAMQIQSSSGRRDNLDAIAGGVTDADGKRTLPATSTAPADSSESSSANSNHHHPPSGHFNFGGTSFGGPSTGTGPSSGSLFQPFQHNNPSSSTTSGTQQNQNPASSFTSPESSGIVVRSSLEDDLADYENDTTSSSNKLPSEGNDNEAGIEEFDGEDREAEADIGGGGGDGEGTVSNNEEREAEGVDS